MVEHSMGSVEAGDLALQNWQSWVNSQMHNLKDRSPLRSRLVHPACQHQRVDMLAEIEPGPSRKQQLLSMNGDMNARDSHQPHQLVVTLLARGTRCGPSTKARHKIKNPAILGQGT